MATLNQLMADLGVVLEKNRAQVTSYLGGGFMAILLGQGHAERGVDSALDLFKVIAEFNRPREVLGLRLLPARIGVASGPVSLGNIGTYHKMDFTAVGPPVNMSARLMRQGDDSTPCISQETADLVQGRFTFKPDSPRTVDLKDIGRRQVWDVTGRSRERTSGVTRL
jgi:adenylate cyclase